MAEEDLTVIPANPPNPPASQFRIGRSLKVRGDAIFIIFAGICVAVVLFVMLMSVNIVLALLLSWLPIAGAVAFFLRFVRERPPYYFEFYLQGLFDSKLHCKKKIAKRYNWIRK